MKTVKDIVLNLKQIEEKGYSIEKNVIKEVDIKIIGHFGNIPCLNILCENVVPYSYHNNISNIGYLLTALVDFFEVGRDEGISLLDLKNIPCRIIFDVSGKNYFTKTVVGFGHAYKDKFVLFNDFSQLNA